MICWLWWHSVIANCCFVAPFPPPINVHLVDIIKEELIFSWSEPFSNCASVSYGITSDCGSCSGTTTAKNVTCSDLQLSSEAQFCTFSVQSMICNSNGESSTLILLTLKGDSIAPYVLQLVHIQCHVTVIINLAICLSIYYSPKCSRSDHCAGVFQWKSVTC